MTLQDLIKIIIEVVEEVLKKEKLNVKSIIFDKSNTLETKKFMNTINDKGTIYYYNDGADYSIPDILIMDYIPVSVIPKIALGISDDKLTEFINGIIISGKKIIVLKNNDECLKNAPSSCVNLIGEYIKLLKSYGIEFLGDSKKNIKQNNIVVKNDTDKVYTNNVLSKKDLLENALNGKITVSKTVIITDLAFETAEKFNIKIERK